MTNWHCVGMHAQCFGCPQHFMIALGGQTSQHVTWTVVLRRVTDSLIVVLTFSAEKPVDYSNSKWINAIVCLQQSGCIGLFCS